MDCIISTIVTPVIDAIRQPLFQELAYMFNLGSNMRNLKNISIKLNQIKDEVQEEIVTATMASDEIAPTKQVIEWMKEVQIMLEDVMVKIDEDYNSHKACLMINCWSRYRISKRAAEVAQEAEELVTKRQQFEGVTVRSAPAIRRMLTLPVVTLSSTEMYLRNAIDHILDSEVGMIGIWGMGGVGKTTLLQRINNHPSVEAVGYDFVIWLVASQELDFYKLQNNIAKRVGLEIEPTGSLDDRARVLHRYLKAKTFLLLLDDVWEPFDLAKLGIPYPSASDDGVPKHKVVLTTRPESVCDQMMAFSQLVRARCSKIRVECLQPEEAWELFLHSVGEGMRSIISSDQRVGQRARIVADKCGGLPLALVVIARTMAANKTWQEWADAINLVNTNGIQEMWTEGSDPFPLLKISYDRLPNDRAKKCFLSCALWSEDVEIGVGELIECWFGMNLIENCGNVNVNYRRGCTIVECLKRACLLEQVDDFYGDMVKMHDIIRGMALWIISSDQRKWMGKSQMILKGESVDAMQWKEAEIILLSYEQIGVLPPHPDCPKLSSLMLRGNWISKVPEGFFQNMPALTFLDLSNNYIKELPPAIGRLLQLRHLNLSHNPVLHSLPAEFGNLAELRVLLLNDLISLIIPPGLISRFQKLEHLALNNASAERDKQGQAHARIVEELACSSITSLELAFLSVENAEQLANNRSKSMRLLALKFLPGITTLLLPSTPLQIGNTSSILSELHIRECADLVNISVSSQCEEEFESLEWFTLENNHSLRKITFLGPVHGSPLRNVRFLKIGWCTSLRGATWILQLPYIESLEISCCYAIEYVIGNEEAEDGDEMESMIGNEEADQDASYTEVDPAQRMMREEENLKIFPHLKSLVLLYLPKLRCFSTHAAVAFPSLKNLCINGCPLLNTGPFRNVKIRQRRSKYGKRVTRQDTTSSMTSTSSMTTWPECKIRWDLLIKKDEGRGINLF